MSSTDGRFSPEMQDQEMLVRRRWFWGLPAAAAVLSGLGGACLWLRTELMADSTPPPFDGERAFHYLEQLCAFGPRPSGSEGMEKQRAMLRKFFRGRAARLTVQEFQAVHPLNGRPVAMTNLVAAWRPERSRRIVIGAHYDTRPHPDQETDPDLRGRPFLGANDGASGVAVLMELANTLGELPTSMGVDLVLFDGEELVFAEEGEYSLGAKHFADEYLRARDSFRYTAGVVVDMVGKKNLRIDQEQYSYQLAHPLLKEIWSTAKRLRVAAFKPKLGHAVVDDHLPLNNAGIPTVDLIDFDYPDWHRVSDTPDKCSAASLAQVGRVLAAWLRAAR